MRSPVNGRRAACGCFAEQVEEYRMWIEFEHPREENRRENLKFVVQLVLTLAAALAAGIAINFFAPFHV
jgi:hypothetical protein